MDKSIVCGVDGSADSQAALAAAIDLAARLRLRLIMANVVEPSHAPYVALGLARGRHAASASSRPPTCRKRPRTSCSPSSARAMGLEQADRRVVVGYAAERLADLADEEEAEMIVVGSRGRGAFKAAFLGSVSTSLIGVARCPVLVVPPGARSGP